MGRSENDPYLPLNLHLNLSTMPLAPALPPYLPIVF